MTTKFYASSDTNSTGGAIDLGSEIVTATLNNLFDNVSGAESAAGMTDYRCIFLRFEDVGKTLTVVETFLDTLPGNANTTISVGLDPAGVDASAASIANENTAPAGVTFSNPTTGSRLSVPDLAHNSYIALWVRRVVTAGATSFANDSVGITVAGDK